MYQTISEAETETVECMPPTIRNARGALIVAHPGHELRVHGWVELARPVVYIITDGSGNTGRPRLETTTGLLFRAGAKPGSIYGRFTDAQVYTAILNQDVDTFIRLTEELAESLVREEIEYAVGDAIEGYNPAHDICRAVIDAAIELATPTGNRIANFEFPVVGPIDSRDDETGALAIRLTLDQSALNRKLASADSYSELRVDIKTITNEIGSEAFEIESFHRVIAGRTRYGPEASPYYERYGERQVAQGHYGQVIRYREHVLPLTDAIWNRVRS